MTKKSISLRGILQINEILTLTPEQEKILELTSIWGEITESLSSKTKPMTFQNGVLRVATCSNALSQDLQFKTVLYLDRINKKLKLKVKRIMFYCNPGEFYQYSKEAGKIEVMDGHPNYSEDKKKIVRFLQSDDPVQALSLLARTVQQRQQNWENCSTCKAQTPKQELNRWGVCACCWVKTKKRG